MSRSARFSQIVVLDETGLNQLTLDKLSNLSSNPIRIYHDYPQTEQEVIDRIQDADCVLVSWFTQLTAAAMRKAPNLRYVGMCCSLYDEQSANVDIAYAKEHDITVKGVRDYGDEGLVEYIVSELIQLIKGLSSVQWRDEPMELSRRKIGIIGMGTTGQMLADRLSVFGAEIFYYNRSRKPHADSKGCIYLPLDELLREVEIVSLHLPKNTSILGANEFNQLGNGKILINTSLGLTFDKEAFLDWIKQDGNYALFDGDGIGACKKEFDEFPNILSTDIVSGWTKEAKDRLSDKVLQNVRDFINKH